MLKHSLSESRQQLVEVMQRLNFGWIENLHVSAGEPILRLPLRTVRDIVLGKHQGHVTLPEDADYELKQQITDLFDLFEREPSLEIERLEVQNGLPFRVNIAEKAGMESTR